MYMVMVIVIVIVNTHQNTPDRHPNWEIHCCSCFPSRRYGVVTPAVTVTPPYSPLYKQQLAFFY